MDASDPFDEARYHTRLAAATFDGNGWVADDPGYPVWDATNEETGDPVPMSDPMFAVWMARILGGRLATTWTWRAPTAGRS